MSFLWLDSGVQQRAPANLGHERRAESVEKTTATHAVHPRHDPPQQDEQSGNQSATGKKAASAYNANQAVPMPSPNLLAETIMSSPVITISTDTDILRVWQLLQENPFRHLPVTSGDQQQIMGIVSDRSISKALAHSYVSKDKPASIIDVMRKPVLVATRDTDIRHIAKIMVSQRIGAMPIVDELQHLVGIISRSDILRTIVKNHDLTLWA